MEKKELAKLSQKERVLDYLKNNKTLDSVDAVYQLSVGRLPNRICELKQMGYVFKQKLVEKINALGQTYEVMQYELITKEVA